MRSGDTYRSERRNTWRVTRINGLMPWPAFNTPAPKYDIGSVQNERVTIRSPARSSYMPHQGKREMERRAGQVARQLAGDNRASRWCDKMLA